MKAWQLFKSKKNWCQHNFARDKNGMGVDSADSTAVSFCAIGALRKIYGEGSEVYFTKSIRLNDYIADKTIFSGPTGWNDSVNQRWGHVKAVLKGLNL
jgi:hypothetical protein